MQPKVLTGIILLMLLSILGAEITEDTASSSALCGITMLSESVGDYVLSPIIGKSGICFSYHKPFSAAGTDVYSLASSWKLKPVMLHSGISYLDHPDYLRQNPYLGVALHTEFASLGYTQHLIYERISTDNSYYVWTADLALSFWSKEYITEIRYLHITEADAELHLGTGTWLGESTLVATDYVYKPHGRDSYRAASSFCIGRLLLIQSSWQTEPSRFGFGIKLMLKSGELMYSIRTHPALNLSHCVDIGFNW